MIPSLWKANDMQQIITAKLKLITTPEQFAALHETQLAYRDALNAVSRYAFEQGKISNVTRLHKGMYTELRARYLPLSRATIWRLARDHEQTGFPLPVRLSDRAIGWRRSEILQYLATRQGR